MTASRTFRLSPPLVHLGASAATLVLVGCSKPYADLAALDFSEVPYESPYLRADDAVVSAYDLDIACPDGEPARVFAVYRTGNEGNAPVAIVLHSGAFDYVVDPDPTNAVGGVHYQGDSRLSRGWAVGKVAETLGMAGAEVDPSEQNLGTLTAALTDAGFVQLYPGNCWGDLWHNEEGYQDGPSEEEGFDRNGRSVAYWMLKSIFEPSFRADRGIDLANAGGIDTNQIYLLGLGDGARGVVEVLNHPDVPKPAGILLDSPPDRLSAYYGDSQTFADEIVGIERIFGVDNIPALDTWSLYGTSEAVLPPRIAYIWSSADTRQPIGTSDATAARISAIDTAWVADIGDAAHVFSNQDEQLALDAVEYLLQGTKPPER